MVLTTYGRSSGLLHRPDREKAAQPFLSRLVACCRSAPPAATSRASSARTGTSRKSREMDTLMDAASPRRDRRRRRSARLHGASPSRTTIRSSSPSTRWTPPTRAAPRHRRRVAVTAGYIGVDARREFYAKMDAANVDLKAFTDEFYVKLCGAHLQPVLDTLVYLRARDRRLVRDHDAADPGQERFATPRSRRCRVDRARARHRRAAAFHRVPSRLQDDRPAAHAGGSAHARARHRASARASATSTPATCTTGTGGTTFCHADARSAHRPRLARDSAAIEVTADRRLLAVMVPSCPAATRRSSGACGGAPAPCPCADRPGRRRPA